jgi:hypothetical protein
MMTLIRVLASTLFIVAMLSMTALAASPKNVSNDNIDNAFTAAQDMFKAIAPCMHESKSTCTDAIDAGKKAKKFAEAAVSDNISAAAKSRVKNAIDIIDATLDQLSRNELLDAEQKAAAAMGELDEAKKVL